MKENSKLRKLLGRVCIIAVTVVIAIFVLRSFSKKLLFSAVGNHQLKTAEVIVTVFPSLVDEYEVNNRFLAGLRDWSSNTPLLEACENRDVDMIRLLVEKGADVNKGSNVVEAYPFTTVLSMGFLWDGEDVVWLLIDNGADLAVDSRDGTVPQAMFSLKVNDDDVEKQERTLALLTYLDEQGIPLKSSSEWRSYGINKLLGYAARCNQVLSCKYLLDNGYYEVDEIVDRYGRTSLIIAAKEGSHGACKLLLEYGADKSIKDNEGKTAYDYAIENGYAEVAELLKD